MAIVAAYKELESTSKETEYNLFIYFLCISSGNPTQLPSCSPLFSLTLLGVRQTEHDWPKVT